ncbi:DUF4303 domain-containing protein [uncultured Gimesia sp.]|mgnify:CR=1 FL=1|uniref:DUF4303 domain-containing protein n=1 Tax=uncultured Gimesia sp. TaxID=1678688 RepID=UPI0026073794|nr:DUF4303 domain-containing protein [uncultured Gimesia sp.]
MSLEQVHALRNALLADARNAFTAAISSHSHELLYGFALYTDDSASGVDVAFNSVEAFNDSVARPRSNSFESFWFTVEWKYEGGFAAHFEQSSRIIESMMPNYQDVSEYDLFRDDMFEAIIYVMDKLVREGLFVQFRKPEDSVIQIAISDSDDNEQYMDRSLKELNPTIVYERYEAARLEAGY